MKVLYAIQGTGNGHLSRSRDIIPILQKHCDLDLLISGYQANVELPWEVKYRLRGLSFIFGKSGGVDIWKTLIKTKPLKLIREIKTLPVKDYDLVINDFEPVSAWASRRRKVPCIGLSHQSAVLNKKAPQPSNKDLIGYLVLKKYAPVKKAYGFHFKAYDDHIFTPVIRPDIRNAQTKKLLHYTVYLPAYSDNHLIDILGKIPEVEWQVFSKHSNHVRVENNVHIQPISNEAFIKSLVTCTGVLCGAGFETPAEALFLKKKVMVIPMKGQYEQHCNAAGANDLGVPVIQTLSMNYLEDIKKWVMDDSIIEVTFPDITEDIINMLFEDFKKSVDNN